MHVESFFPELEEIKCVPSQIMDFEHVENNLGGSTITEKNGDIYYIFPTSKTYRDEKGKIRGMLHFGLDFPGPVDNPYTIPISEEVFASSIAYTDVQFPATKGQPPSRIWTGPMGFTEDHIPIIGFFNKNVIISAAFQGYGGSFCTQAGYVAAEMALTGKVHPDAPEDVFSPKRFLSSP